VSIVDNSMGKRLKKYIYIYIIYVFADKEECLRRKFGNKIENGG